MAVKFTIKHVFRNITLEAYERLFFDEAFNDAIMPIAGLKSRVQVELKEENGIVHRKTRVIPIRDFPPPINKLVSGELSYVEVADFHRAEHRHVWRSDISVMPDKIKMGGDITFAPSGDGVVRTVTGECKVSIFGIGGIVEKIIVDNIVETYDKVARFTQRWIDDGKIA
jgi:hypothetical protein